VETYFTAVLKRPDISGPQGSSDRITRTLLPPIYLQQPGHSLTIVGFERYVNGVCAIIVLDPMYLTAKAMHQLVDAGPRNIRRYKEGVMDVYRRGDERLEKHLDFEILT
jgi:hypothetical protein